MPKQTPLKFDRTRRWKTGAKYCTIFSDIQIMKPDRPLFHSNGRKGTVRFRIGHSIMGEHSQTTPQADTAPISILAAPRGMEKDDA